MCTCMCSVALLVFMSCDWYEHVCACDCVGIGMRATRKSCGREVLTW